MEVFFQVVAQGSDFPLGTLHLLVIGGLHMQKLIRDHVLLAFLVYDGVVVHQIEQKHGGAEQDAGDLQIKIRHAVFHVENLNRGKENPRRNQKGNGSVQSILVALSHVAKEDEQEGEKEKQHASRHLGQRALDQKTGLRGQRFIVKKPYQHSRQQLAGIVKHYKKVGCQDLGSQGISEEHAANQYGKGAVKNTHAEQGRMKPVGHPLEYKIDENACCVLGG